MHALSIYPRVLRKEIKYSMKRMGCHINRTKGIEESETSLLEGRSTHERDFFESTRRIFEAAEDFRQGFDCHFDLPRGFSE